LLTGVLTTDDPFEDGLHGCQLICMGTIAVTTWLAEHTQNSRNRNIQTASQHLGCSTNLTINNGINLAEMLTSSTGSCC